MFRAERLPYLGALVLAAVLLSQALRLEDFSAFGPGPGIFPQIAAAVATAIALLLLLVPVLSREAEAKPADADEQLAPDERRTFYGYMVGLVLLVVGSAWLGFLVTCMLVSLLLVWHAERRSLLGAICFGLACGIAGTVGLGFLLNIEIPYAAADSLLLRPFR